MKSENQPLKAKTSPVYENQIKPLFDKIIAICKENRTPLLLSLGFNPNGDLSFYTCSDNPFELTDPKQWNSHIYIHHFMISDTFEINLPELKEEANGDQHENMAAVS